MNVVIYGNYINECIIYVIIQHINVYFFVFFSNNVGFYDLQSDPTIHDPIYLPRSYLGSRFRQPWHQGTQTLKQ